MLPALWQATFDELLDRVSTRFCRIEPRLVARDLVAAILAPVEAKNCGKLAEHAGHRGPSKMQRLPRDAVWDAPLPPEAVLMADETGFLKKGV